MEKKKEKMEERLARQKVKDDIERDKRERAAKFGRASTEALPTVPPTVAPTPPVPSPAPVQQRNYDQCKLQIRLPSGSALVQTFSASEQLAAVRLYVEMNRKDGGTGPVGLMTTFPRKVFTEEEMDMPLSQLGLLPSAVLVVTKTP
ncbi:UBX domain-containing protein 1 [Lamellibrachia satsuma]|nr:UBX domain-containing protein 1 [Lamellibrachia satsuma]